MRGVTDNGPDIQAFLQYFQLGGIRIDNRDVVFLVREAVGYTRANLACAKHDYFHVVCP